MCKGSADKCKDNVARSNSRGRAYFKYIKENMRREM
jgi:hypothetical protein